MTMQARSPLRGSGRCSALVCKGGACGGALGIENAAFARMMPMHVVVALDGTILRAGPTLAKLRSGQDLIGTPFLSHFDIRLPREVSSVADLVKDNGRPLRLLLRDRDRTGLKGQAAPLECGKSILIDLSFGISVVDAVGRFGLTSSDFGGTDLSIELLFLVEAQRAALGESRRFSKRLDSARVAAIEDSTTDRLTGTRNRRAVDHLLEDLVAQRIPFGVLHFDIDGFKAVNDLCGHPGGDAVLKEVANSLRSSVRPDDMVARTGGDEFMIVLPRVADAEEPGRVAQRILKRLDMPVIYGDQSFRIRASIGAAHSAQFPTLDLDELLRSTDAALFAAKRAGGAGFAVAR